MLQIERCSVSYSCAEKSAQVAIHLADGAPVRPARDLFSHIEPTVRLRTDLTSSDQGRQAQPGDPLCASQDSFSSAPEVPFDDLGAAAPDLVLPDFTEVALKTKLQGTVILELLVENGAVACVKTIKSLPMGLTEAARKAALQWRLSPSPDRTGPVRSVVAFEFSRDEVGPDPEE